MSLFDYPVMLFKMFLPKKETVVKFQQVGWTITIPKKFDIMSEGEMARMGKRFRKNIRSKIEKEVKLHLVEKQFWASYEIENKFGCNITSMNEVPETEWKNKNNDLCNTMLAYYRACYKDFAHISITTEQDFRQKGDIIFDTFDIIAAIPERQVHRTRYYRTVYKNYGIVITMSFANEKIGEEMLNMLRTSTFSD